MRNVFPFLILVLFVDVGCLVSGGNNKRSLRDELLGCKSQPEVASLIVKVCQGKRVSVDRLFEMRKLLSDGKTRLKYFKANVFVYDIALLMIENYTGKSFAAYKDSHLNVKEIFCIHKGRKVYRFSVYDMTENQIKATISKFDFWMSGYCEDYKQAVKDG